MNHLQLKLREENMGPFGKNENPSDEKPDDKSEVIIDKIRGKIYIATGSHPAWKDPDGKHAPTRIQVRHDPKS